MSVNRESTLRASRKGRTAIAVGALLSLGLAACTTDANDAITTTTAAPAGASTTTTETPLPMGDIVATALTGHVFTELAGLALDAGLVETLRGGPFTVFAPTDAAFAKVPVPVLHAIQDNADMLKTVLLHHVVPGTITPDQLAAGELTTAAGDKLAVTKVGDKFYVDGNKVGAAVQATNGLRASLGSPFRYDPIVTGSPAIFSLSNPPTGLSVNPTNGSITFKIRPVSSTLSGILVGTGTAKPISGPTTRPGCPYSAAAPCCARCASGVGNRNSPKWRPRC